MLKTHAEERRYLEQALLFADSLASNDYLGETGKNVVQKIHQNIEYYIEDVLLLDSVDNYNYDNLK